VSAAEFLQNQFLAFGHWYRVSRLKFGRKADRLRGDQLARCYGLSSLGYINPQARKNQPPAAGVKNAEDQKSIFDFDAFGLAAAHLQLDPAALVRGQVHRRREFFLIAEKFSMRRARGENFKRRIAEIHDGPCDLPAIRRRAALNRLLLNSYLRFHDKIYAL
jgi:hypothetical protein